MMTVTTGKEEDRDDEISELFANRNDKNQLDLPKKFQSRRRGTEKRETNYGHSTTTMMTVTSHYHSQGEWNGGRSYKLIDIRSHRYTCGVNFYRFVCVVPIVLLVSSSSSSY